MDEKTEALIDRDFGERCLDFAEGCAACEAWVAYDMLAVFRPIPPAEDA